MRVKSEAKRDGIVDAAMAVFLEKGYEAASMSDIARRAGGSKATLYSYFASKEALYVEVMDVRCSARFEQAFGTLRFDGDLYSTLSRFGVSLFTELLAPDMLATRRNIVHDAGRSDIGRLFFERGPERGLRRLADFLGAQMSAGRLRQADPELAARHLLALMDSDLLMRAMLGVTGEGDAPTLAAHIDAAVRVFLCAYGPGATLP
jgi:AcrR family transcriptional regulator